MSDRWRSCEERILELLADEAAFGLSAGEQEDLTELLPVIPEFDRDCMQRNAATVQLESLGTKLEPLPASFRPCEGATLNVRVSHEPE